MKKTSMNIGSSIGHAISVGTGFAFTAEWDDKGSVVNTSDASRLLTNCPRCSVQLQSGLEHRCGNRVLPKGKQK